MEGQFITVRPILLIFTTLAFAAATLAFAQEAVILPVPAVPVPAYADLKAYLTLTDAQVTALADVLHQRMQAEQVIRAEINQKQQTLNQLLASDSTDAARIGQLSIDIHQLLKKLPLNGDPYRSQALSVLTADQRAKLPALVTALRLQSAGWQAITLNLIDNPVTIQPRIMDTQQ
jgi:hypothetical protein